MNRFAQEISGAAVKVDKLELCREYDRKKYRADFVENFESVLAAVEGLDGQIKDMQSKYLNLQVKKREQKDPLTLMNGRGRMQCEKRKSETVRTAGQKPIQRPPKFDRKSVFLAQFEIAACMNERCDEEKASFLATSLMGNATLVLSNLSGMDRRNYQVLVTSLTSKLKTNKLKSRFQRKDETLPELVQSVESLTRNAYPDATPELHEVLARDFFIDALTDEDL